MVKHLKLEAKMTKKNHPQYLDKTWFERFSKAESRINKYLNNYHKDKINFPKQKGKLFIRYKKLSLEQISKISSQIKQSELDLRKIRHDLNKNESSKLIKDYYLNKIEELFIRIQIWKLRYTKEDLNENDRSKKIYSKLKLLYPIPTRNQREKFLNEFILFIKYILKENPFEIKKRKRFKELTNYRFYRVKKKDLKIDFSESINKFLEIRNNPEFFSDDYYANQIKDSSENYLKELELHKSVKIKIKDKRYLFAVTAQNEFLIPEQAKLNKYQLLKLLSHELGVHSLRNRNGKLFKTSKGKKLRLLNSVSLRNLSIEEGLATYKEQNLFYKSSESDVLNLYLYYIRIIAIYLGMQCEPSDVYKKIYAIFNLFSVIFHKDKKWVKTETHKLILRLYRDFISPAKGSINPRVGQYLLGNRKIWSLVKAGFDTERLMIGKINLEQLDQISTL